MTCELIESGTTGEGRRRNLEWEAVKHAGVEVVAAHFLGIASTIYVTSFIHGYFKVVVLTALASLRRRNFVSSRCVNFSSLETLVNEKATSCKYSSRKVIMEALLKVFGLLIIIVISGT